MFNNKNLPKIKIGICGKSNSGKDTTAKMIANYLSEYNDFYNLYKITSFAEPIKKITELYFPHLNDEYLYGPSDLRNIELKEFTLDNKTLVVRDFLKLIGTEIGRNRIDHNIWINNFNYNYVLNNKYNLLICSDVRFENEFNFLKENNFILIKIKRNNTNKNTHVSEIEQDLIPESSYDCIINNNAGIKELKNYISKMADSLLKT